MIVLVAASAVFLAASQAALNAPTNAFKACLKQADAKAKSEKVAGDGFEAYARTTCASQLSGLRAAVISFNMKNGMSRKTATNDAELTVADWLDGSVEHYKFMAGVNQPQAAPAAAAAATPPPSSAPATPAPTPAAAAQPPK
jgi:hypothetical protein